MSGDPRDDLTENSRESWRKRSLERRGSSVRGDTHSVVVCPGCRGHIPVRSDYGDPPATCGDCGERLRCEACDGDLTDADRGEDSALASGMCPRCGESVDGSGTTPGEESFTWDET